MRSYILCLYLLIQFSIPEAAAFILLFYHVSCVRTINIFAVTFLILFGGTKSRRASSQFTFSVFGILCALCSALHFKNLLVSLCPTEFFMPLDFCLTFLHIQSKLYAVLKLELSYLIFHWNCHQTACVHYSLPLAVPDRHEIEMVRE